MAYADDLLQDALELATRGTQNLKQSSLRRAVSTAYYAAFHLLVADFVSHWSVPEQRTRLARMFEHRRMSGAVLEIRDKQEPSPVESQLKQLIAKFTELQTHRNQADYNTDKSWSPSEVSTTLRNADQIFAIWKAIRTEKIAQDHLMSMFGARH